AVEPHMIDEEIVLGPEDIERDLEGTRKAEARVNAFFRQGAGGRFQTRSGGVLSPTRVETAGGIARRLVDRCPADTQQRYRTLLSFEPVMPGDGDYGTLIGAACNIVEAELRRLLATP